MSMKTKPLLITILVLVLIVLGYFIIPKLFKSSKPLEKSIMVLPFKAENSIAVLPFKNDSTNDSSAYFINGIMEEILSDLSKIKDMKVLSRTSVEPYRNTTKSIAEIAKELGVVYILEVSGQRNGDNIQLRVQLIDAKNDKHLWSESYEKEILKADDILAVQTQIAQAITTAIKALITP
jgi:TolB-like protein